MDICFQRKHWLKMGKTVRSSNTIIEWYAKTCAKTIKLHRFLTFCSESWKKTSLFLACISYHLGRMVKLKHTLQWQPVYFMDQEKNLFSSEEPLNRKKNEESHGVCGTHHWQGTFTSISVYIHLSLAFTPKHVMVMLRVRNRISKNDGFWWSWLAKKKSTGAWEVWV